MKIYTKNAIKLDKFIEDNKEFKNKITSDCEIIKETKVEVESIEVELGEYTVLIEDNGAWSLHMFGKDDRKGRNTAIVQNTIRQLSKLYNKIDCYLYYCESYKTWTDFKPYNQTIIKAYKTLGVKVYDSQDDISTFDSIESYVSEKDHSIKRNSANKSMYLDIENSNAFIKLASASGTESLFMLMFYDHFKDRKLTITKIKEPVDSNFKLLLEYIENNGHYLNEDAYYDEVKGKVLVSNDSMDIEDIRNQALYADEVDKNYDKLNKEKCCAICKTKNQRIIEHAHLVEVRDIKKMDWLSTQEKVDLANSGKNGILLCTNHHKLFDAHSIIIKEGKLVNRSLEPIDDYIAKTIDQLGEGIDLTEILGSEIVKYSSKRYELKPI